MADAFDDRLVSLTVQIENQTFTFDQEYYILASGTKYTDGNLGECAIRIDNISKQTRDFLVTKTSPWVTPRIYANIALAVGRKSTGTFVLFAGQASAANPTQPPNIGLTFTSLTMSALLGNIGTLNAGQTATLRSISQQIANSLPNPTTGAMGIPLDFQATSNPNINNYSFSGPLIRQVEKLNEIAGVNAFIDNNVLIVKDNNAARTGTPHIISSQTGMIGVPEVNELGVKAQQLISNEIRVGDACTVQSAINAAANGTFIIYKLGFDIASRDTPFYWNLDMRAQQNALGFQP